MQCPKCLNRYYGTDRCPVCSVSLVPDDDKKTINKRLKKSKTTNFMRPVLWLIRAALELFILYWGIYFLFFYVCRFLAFVATNMDTQIRADIGSPGALWLRYAAFGLVTLAYVMKRKRL